MADTIYREGDVLLFAKTRWWISRWIARWTRSDFSHVSLYLSAGRILEISPPHVRVVPWEFYGTRPYRVVRPPLTDSAARSAAFYGASFAGKPYGTPRLVSYILARNLRQRWVWRGMPLVCSGYVALAWWLAGLKWFDDEGRELDPRSGVAPATISRQANREGWEKWEHGNAPHGH